MKTQALFFKALADETRLQILWLLIEEEELCVCDIMRVLGITQSKASRHLRYLYNVGLVSDRREGVWMYYRLCVAPGSLQEKQLQLLSELLEAVPKARALKENLQQWLRTKARLADTEAANAPDHEIGLWPDPFTQTNIGIPRYRGVTTWQAP